jgi:hypothetical protein
MFIFDGIDFVTRLWRCFSCHPAGALSVGSDSTHQARRFSWTLVLDMQETLAATTLRIRLCDVLLPKQSPNGLTEAHSFSTIS